MIWCDTPFFLATPPVTDLWVVGPAHDRFIICSVGIVKRILAGHMCGWYYRVVEEGEAEAGDVLELVERVHESSSVARVFAALYDPKSEATGEELGEIAALDRLTDQWRDKTEKWRNG